MINNKGVRKPYTCKQVQSKIEHIEQQFQSAHDWAAHTGQGIEEDDPDSFCADVEKRCQYYSDLLEIFSDHASAQPDISSDWMKNSKATPTCTTPRRTPHRMNYLESDSSNEDKSDENALLDDQDREEVVEALANARAMIGALERGKSMKEDKDETIGEKQEDSSFVQTTTTTQADFYDGDSLSSQAPTVLPEVTAASSEVAGPRTTQNRVDRTLCMSNIKSDKRKREKENLKKKRTPRVDPEIETFVTMQNEQVLHHDASSCRNVNSMINNNSTKLPIGEGILSWPC